MRHAVIKEVAARLPALLPPSGRVVLAFSGGSDSVALFHILRVLRHRLGFRLHLLHVNHGLRPEAGAEERWVNAFAAGFAVPLFVYPVTATPPPGAGIEDWARRQRLAAYHRVLAWRPAPAIATAHHLNDLFETMLLALFKGNMGHPLAPMQVSDHGIIRPLLDSAKQTINAFIRAFGLAHLTDRSNLNVRFERNYLRHEVVPQVLARFPGALSKARQYCRRFSELEDMLRSRLAEELNALQCPQGHGDGWCLDRPGFLARPLYWQKRILRYVLEQAAHRPPSYNLVLHALRLVQKGGLFPGLLPGLSLQVDAERILLLTGPRGHGRQAQSR